MDVKPIENQGRGPLVGAGSVAIICFTLLVIFGVSVAVYLWKSSKPLMQVNLVTELFDNTEFVQKLSNLELASRTTTETVEESEQTIVRIPMWGTEKSEANYSISFMAKYVYHVSADRSKWGFKLEDGVAYVSAPALEAGEPSVFTESIKAEYKGGMLVFKEKDKLEQMKKNISSYARGKASKKTSKDMVRETARASLEKFIADWFLKNNPRVKAIKVTFADDGTEENASPHGL